MKLIYRGDCHSIDCSVIILSVAIWSVLDLFFSVNQLVRHVALFILSNSMLVKTLLSTDMSVIPLQFLHIPMPFFYGSFTRYPFFHYVGTFSCSQIFRNRWCNISVFVIGSVFRASGGMPSGPGVFPSFSIFSALLI